MRNLIAHASCRGCWKSDPNRIVFAAYEAASVGEMTIIALHVARMDECTAWAERVATEVEQIVNVLDPLPPQ